MNPNAHGGSPGFRNCTRLRCPAMSGVKTSQPRDCSPNRPSTLSATNVAFSPRKCALLLRQRKFATTLHTRSKRNNRHRDGSPSGPTELLEIRATVCSFQARALTGLSVDKNPCQHSHRPSLLILPAVCKNPAPSLVPRLVITTSD